MKFLFALQNQVLWAVELHTDDGYWNEVNIDVCLVDTLDDLINSLHGGYLPNFFDESENVLSNKDQGILDGLADCLSEELDSLQK